MVSIKPGLNECVAKRAGSCGSQAVRERFNCQELSLCNRLTGKKMQQLFREIGPVLSIGTTPNGFSVLQAYK